MDSSNLWLALTAGMYFATAWLFRGGVLEVLKREKNQFYVHLFSFIAGVFWPVTVFVIGIMGVFRRLAR